MNKIIKQEIVFILKLSSIPFLILAQLIITTIKVLNSILIEDMELDKYLEKKFNEHL